MLELGKERVSSVVRLGRDCRREPMQEVMVGIVRRMREV